MATPSRKVRRLSADDRYCRRPTTDRDLKGLRRTTGESLSTDKPDMIAICEKLFSEHVVYLTA
ncbi:MAG: hypothetical protein F4170_03645 [Rhodobacteraceae bacterium]|nr:hypothetical protein [Paracoccaceae bacterium]MYJ87617.1 hypothetical protein [Paracoccaceae bacterium]